MIFRLFMKIMRPGTLAVIFYVLFHLFNFILIGSFSFVGIHGSRNLFAFFIGRFFTGDEGSPNGISLYPAGNAGAPAAVKIITADNKAKKRLF